MTQNYPGYPPAWSGYSGPPVRYVKDRGPAPGVVRAAVVLMAAGVVLSLVGLAITLATSESTRRHIERRDPDIAFKETHLFFTVTNVVGGVFGVAFAGFFGWLAWQVGKGTNWARIVTWVFGGNAIVGAPLSFVQYVPVASHVVSIAMGVVDLAIVVLLALRPSNDYFRGPTVLYGPPYPPSPYPPT